MADLSKIRAKSDPPESLLDHTSAAIAVWQQIYQRYQDVLPLDHGCWMKSLQTVAFHDLGKCIDNFQDMLDKRATDHVRHEFISGLFLLLQDCNAHVNDPLGLLAVFSHHKRLNISLFDESPPPVLRLRGEVLREMAEAINDLMQQACPTAPRIPAAADALSELETAYDDLYRCFYSFWAEYLIGRGKLHGTQRPVYIFYKAIIQICDWTASGHRALSSGVSYTPELLGHFLMHKLFKAGKPYQHFTWRRFQQQSMVGGHVLAIAPTGSGKTEAALLWASQKRPEERVVYLLPTRVTSNAMFQRLSGFFPDGEIAVVHSSALLLRKEMDQSYKEYLQDKTFFKNISICTVDQMLTQGFNLGYWELKTFHLFRAWVIIDEIHLYEPYTLGLIIATIKYLKKYFQTRFFVMSATMPARIQSLIGNALETYELIKDEELLEQSRNTFEVQDAAGCSIEAEVARFLRGATQFPVKVLVVLNTVDEAIRVFRELKQTCSDLKIEILCYHSRFMYMHRKEQEESIFELEQEGRSCVLVATQVVEVSLDIDYDILFSENAPIDALIQRAGRVNRKGAKQHSKVIVFPHGDISAQYIYTLPKVLERTLALLREVSGTRLTERRLIGLVEEVYQDYVISEQPEYQEGLRRHQEIQEKHHHVGDADASEDVFTRQGLDTVPVIPQQYKDEAGRLHATDRTRYEVAVRKWVTKQPGVKVAYDGDGFCYISLAYDRETGLHKHPGPAEKSPSSIFL